MCKLQFVNRLIRNINKRGSVLRFINPLCTFKKVCLMDHSPPKKKWIIQFQQTLSIKVWWIAVEHEKCNFCRFLSTIYRSCQRVDESLYVNNLMCLTLLSKSPIDTFPFFSGENFIEPSASDSLQETKVNSKWRTVTWFFFFRKQDSSTFAIVLIILH